MIHTILDAHLHKRVISFFFSLILVCLHAVQLSFFRFPFPFTSQRHVTHDKNTRRPLPKVVIMMIIETHSNKPKTA